MRKKTNARNYSYQKSTIQQRKSQANQNVHPNVILYTNQNRQRQSIGDSKLHQQLRQALEHVQQYKLSSQLEAQKCTVVTQKYNNLKEENVAIKKQFEQLKQDFLKFKRRQEKSKTKQRQFACQKCKNLQEKEHQIQRERQVYSKEKNIMKNQIQRLQATLQQNKGQAQANKFKKYVDSIKMERQNLISTIQDQKILIDLLDDRISAYQLENLQILGNVELLQHKMEELKMQNSLLKGFSRKQKSPTRRKTGSIKTLDRASQLVTQQKESFIS